MKICLYIIVTFKEQLSSCEEVILIRTERSPYTVKRVKPASTKCQDMKRRFILSSILQCVKTEQNLWIDFPVLFDFSQIVLYI